jgi:hypothetical protein
VMPCCIPSATAHCCSTQYWRKCHRTGNGEGTEGRSLGSNSLDSIFSLINRLRNWVVVTYFFSDRQLTTKADGGSHGSNKNDRLIGITSRYFADRCSAPGCQVGGLQLMPRHQLSRNRHVSNTLQAMIACRCRVVRGASPSCSHAAVTVPADVGGHKSPRKLCFTPYHIHLHLMSHLVDY